MNWIYAIVIGVVIGISPSQCLKIGEVSGPNQRMVNTILTVVKFGAESETLPT